MRRAVLDSSVLISAFLTPRGTSAQVLRAAERSRFALCISHEIIAETTRSLRQKSRRIRRYYPNYADADVDRFAEMIALTGDVVGDLPGLRVVPLDPKDDVIVATAVKAQAGYLVTGDRHLLALGSHGSIQMVTPRQFLDLL
jgi:putative PIN family toxin of toxin-antitoxin system